MQSFTEFEIDAGAIPFTQLYDRTGELRYTITVVAEIEDRVCELLDEAA